ncbi:MAG: heavy metal sensor histidine kinase [Polaromonas sp.]|nr:heavy metal sensor histidine kinase [Polaromonas sp.]
MTRHLKRWFYKISLATHIALASVIFGVVIAGGAVIVAFFALMHQLDARSSAELASKRELLTHLLAEIPSLQAIDQNRRRLDDLMVGQNDLYLALVDPSNEQVLATFSPFTLQSIGTDKTTFDASSAFLKWLSPSGDRVMSLQGDLFVGNGKPVMFYLSLDRRDDFRLFTSFAEGTALSFPVLLLMVALGAWLIARTALSPLRRFKRLAASIDPQSLTQRVSLAGLPLELAELAKEFNQMLDRIDSGYTRLQEFSGDLAHEMRTPVATLLGRSQVTLSKTRTAEELQDVMEGNIDQLERLSRLISDMLLIANTDAPGTSLRFESINLEEEVQKVADYMAQVADDKHIQIIVQGTAEVLADRLLVQRAVTNLLSNAIRHADEHSVIAVRVASTSKDVTLAITNQGEPIPAADTQRIFDRFYRVDASRARDQGGAGLGLAIVRSIMSAHGGQVGVKSEHDSTPHETTFFLIFKSAVITRSH